MRFTGRLLVISVFAAVSIVFPLLAPASAAARTHYWHREVVESAAGFGFSLEAGPAGDMYLAYALGPDSNGKIVLARRTEHGEWSKETAAQGRAARLPVLHFAADGTPHILFIAGSGWTNHVVHAWRASGVWLQESVPVLGEGPVVPVDFAMGFDGSVFAVAPGGGLVGGLVLGTRSPSGDWTRENIPVAPGDVGDPKIKIGPSGELLVAYDQEEDGGGHTFDTTGSIWLASRMNGAWVIERAAYYTNPAGSVLLSKYQLWVDPSGKIDLFFQPGDGGMFLASKSALGEWSYWTLPMGDHMFVGGPFSVLEGEGLVNMSFYTYGPGSRDLVVAYEAQDGWGWGTLDAVGDVGHRSDVADSSSVSLAVAYSDDSMGRLKFAIALPFEGTDFADVGKDHLYAPQIQQLSEVGIVSGYGTGEFGPDNPVLRAQFAKMIVGVLGLPVSEQDVSPFMDVSPVSGNLYPDNYVAVAFASGITQGTGTNPLRFSPYSPISRAQMITMVARAAQRLRGDVLDEPSLATAESYSAYTFGYFSVDHAPLAAWAEYNGLLQNMALEGEDPWAPATRGECSAILANLLELGPF